MLTSDARHGRTHARSSSIPIRPSIPAEPLPPIQSRFLFVDVAALRAKQLRRGARRVSGEEVLAPHKAERARDGRSAARPGLLRRAAGETGGRRGRRMNRGRSSDRHGHASGLCCRARGSSCALFIGFCVHRRLHEDEEDGRRQRVGGQEPRRADQPPADRSISRPGSGPRSRSISSTRRNSSKPPLVNDPDGLRPEPWPARITHVLPLTLPFARRLRRRCCLPFALLVAPVPAAAPA